MPLSVKVHIALSQCVAIYINIDARMAVRFGDLGANKALLLHYYYYYTTDNVLLEYCTELNYNIKYMCLMDTL